MPAFRKWGLDYSAEKGDRTGPNILFKALPELSFYDKKLDAKISRKKSQLRVVTSHNWINRSNLTSLLEHSIQIAELNSIKRRTNMAAKFNATFASCPDPAAEHLHYSRPPPRTDGWPGVFSTLPSVLNPLHFICVFSLLLYLARCLLAFITIRKLYRIIFMNSRSKFQDLLASVIFSTYILGHNFIVFCGRYFKII